MTDPQDARLEALYATGTAGEALPPHPEPEAIAAVIERSGAEADRLRTIEHIAVCRRCRREFDLLRAAHVAGRALVAHSRRARVIGLAAAAVLVVAATLQFGRLRAGRGVTASVDRGAVPVDGAAIALVEPAMDASTGPAPLLRWRSVRGAASYHVEVLDSTGAVMATHDTRDTSFAVVPALAPGRTYRWWVQATVNGEPRPSPFGTFKTRP
jgi:hypothetical protein